MFELAFFVKLKFKNQAWFLMNMRFGKGINSNTVKGNICRKVNVAVQKNVCPISGAQSQFLVYKERYDTHS